MKLLKHLKISLMSLIKIFGYELRGIKPLVSHNNFDAIISFLLEKKKNDKHVYFDIGANLGQSIKRFKKINPKSIIHSFEPTHSLYKELIKNFSSDKNIILNQLGLGNKKKIENLYSFKYHKINSIIPIDKKSKFLKSRILATNSTDESFEEIIKVNIDTVDNYCERNNIYEIDLVKIDTQGYEVEVLEGMKNILKKNKVSIIELELILGFAYEKNFSFYDYEKILHNENYKLIAIETASNLIAFSNYQTNLLYVKNEIFEYIRQLHIQNLEIKGVTKKTDRNNIRSY